MDITDILTEKVGLKPIEPEDFDSMKTYLSDDYTMRFFDHGPMGDEAIIDFMSKPVYLIVKRDTHEVIGHFIYHPWFMIDTYEIGWVLNKEYHNQGIITALAKAVLKYAFEEDKAHRVVATCQPENIASKRVCEKSGMRLEGLFKKCIYVERLDQWWDELFYAMLEEEYESLKQSLNI